MRLFSRLAVYAIVATLAGMSAGEGRGARAAVSDDTPQTATILVKSVKPEPPPITRGLTMYGLTRNDYRRIVATIPDIRQAIPVRKAIGRTQYRDRVRDVSLIGTTEAFAGAHGLEVYRGRFLTEKDHKTLENVAVITREIAGKLFLDEDPIGKPLRIGRNYFLIVGVVSRASALPSTNGPDRPEDASQQVFLPLSTMRARLGDVVGKVFKGSLRMEQYELSWIELYVEDPAKLEATANMIRHILRASHEEQEQADYSVEVVGQSADH